MISTNLLLWHLERQKQTNKQTNKQTKSEADNQQHVISRLTLIENNNTIESTQLYTSESDLYSCEAMFQIKPRKNSEASTGFKPVTSAIPV